MVGSRSVGLYRDIGRVSPSAYSTRLHNVQHATPARPAGRAHCFGPHVEQYLITTQRMDQMSRVLGSTRRIVAPPFCPRNTNCHRSIVAERGPLHHRYGWGFAMNGALES
jgi:hypothetical protein